MAPQVLTGRNSVVAVRIKDLLAQFVDDANFFDPQIKGVSYGDQQKVPDSPWLCVEAGTKERTWPPTATDQTEITLEVIILVYYTDANLGNDEVRLKTDQLSEAVEEYLNVNHRQLLDVDGNALVIYSYVLRNESGYKQMGNALYRSARLTWRARSKLRLTQAQ
jgi:hypothetical protein